jgi:LytR cell envelope-related transcriptional attenuator
VNPVVLTEEAEEKPGRSRTQMVALLVGGLLVAVAVAVVAVAVLDSSSGSSKGGASAGSGDHGRGAHTRASSSVTSPASVHVAVLNGTNATGLAHRLSASLQQSGYTQALALDGTPPGEHPTSVVEYAPGDAGEAGRVAQVLSVSQVQPLESSIAALASGSGVVVVAGLDKAGSAGEGGEAVP